MTKLPPGFQGIRVDHSNPLLIGVSYYVSQGTMYANTYIICITQTIDTMNNIIKFFFCLVIVLLGIIGVFSLCFWTNVFESVDPGWQLIKLLSLVTAVTTAGCQEYR